MSKVIKRGILHRLYSFLSVLRIVSFLCMIGFLVAKYAFSTQVSMWFAVCYPIVLLLSWCFLTFIYYKKYPNMKSSFIGTIIMADIVTPLNYFLDSGRAARIWGIWHFRNYKEKKPIGKIVAAWILRLIVLAIIVAIIVSFLSVVI